MPKIKKKTTPKKSGKRTKIAYEEVNVLPYFNKQYNSKALGSLTEDKAKEFIGWTVEEEGEDFKSDFLFKDRLGNKVRCLNNLHNRPFTPGLARGYMLEVLRNKWRLNLETMIIDETGMVQDGQHRLVGFIWACQEYRKNPERWEQYWDHEPVMDVAIGVGISSDDETVNTINTGRRRSLADAVFRSEYFRDLPKTKRQTASKAAEWAIRLIWYRTGQEALSAAPKMPHSEAIEFVDNHPKILEAVRKILELEDVSGYLPLGYAAALFYLMGTCGTDRENYEVSVSEERVDFSMWNDAQDFWTSFADKDKGMTALLDSLLDIPDGVSGSYVRDLRCGLCVKAWNLYIDGKDIKKNAIVVESSRNKDDHLELIENPILGGLDIGGDTSLISGGEDHGE